MGPGGAYLKLLLTILLTLLLVACTGTGTASGGSAPALGPAPDEGQARLLYVVNESHLSTGEVQLGIASVQRQLDNEFRQAWQVQATLVLADPPEADSYRILLVDAYQGDSNAGYHDGVRTAWVATPDSWTEILSHECIEMLVGNVCDPVQRPYSIPPGSPAVENFLLPSGIGFLESKGE